MAHGIPLSGPIPGPMPPRNDARERERERERGRERKRERLKGEMEGGETRRVLRNRAKNPGWPGLRPGISKCSSGVLGSKKPHAAVELGRNGHTRLPGSTPGSAQQQWVAE